MSFKGVILRPKGLGVASVRGILSKCEGDWRELRSDRVPSPFTTDHADLVFRWGCTAPLTYVPAGGSADEFSTIPNEINSRYNMVSLANKLTSRLRMSSSVPVPKTFSTVTGVLRFLEDFPEKKVVLRPLKHKQGKNFWVADRNTNIQELCTSIVEATGQSWYASEYIEKVKEFRVVVFQGRVLFVYEKIPQDASAYAWNFQEGDETKVLGRDWWTHNPEIMKWAVYALRALNLDFGAVDIIQTADGSPYVLEVNTAPQTTGEYRQATIAKCLDYVLNGIYHRLALGSDMNNWRDFVHPALSSEARGAEPNMSAYEVPQLNTIAA